MHRNLNKMISKSIIKIKNYEKQVFKQPISEQEAKDGAIYNEWNE